MTDPRKPKTDSAIDEIAFLANSENRVAVFETLVEAPRSRNEIRTRVGASRVTVARILRELEAREWIEGAGQEYAVTPLGEWVWDAFNCLMEEMEAERRLRELLQWLPSDLLTFDVRHLRDAEIFILDESDSTALVRKIVEFHRSGDRIRGITRDCAPEIIETQWRLTVHGDARVYLVITPDIVDAIHGHPPSKRRFCEMLDQENARYFVCQHVPISVVVVDEAVGINLTDEQGVLKGGLKTDNETVRSWAVDLFETYREKARPVGPEAVRA